MCTVPTVNKFQFFKEYDEDHVNSEEIPYTLNGIKLLGNYLDSKFNNIIEALCKAEPIDIEDSITDCLFKNSIKEQLKLEHPKNLKAFFYLNDVEIYRGLRMSGIFFMPEVNHAFVTEIAPLDEKTYKAMEKGFICFNGKTDHGKLFMGYVNSFSFSKFVAHLKLRTEI